VRRLRGTAVIPPRWRYPVPRTDFTTVEFTDAASTRVGDRIWHVNGLYEIADMTVMRIKGASPLVYIELRRTPALRASGIPFQLVRGGDDEMMRAER
jgi:hypothetical protein